MKKITLGLLMALTISTPALATWKDEVFAKLDADDSGELTISELAATGCKVNPRLFIYADKDHSGGLNKNEFFVNRDLFRRCIIKSKG
jgi:hypothetical protein